MKKFLKAFFKYALPLAITALTIYIQMKKSSNQGGDNNEQTPK